ncbi:MAG: hypothetical protein WKG07_18920 [Hymenobacter sp.]
MGVADSSIVLTGSARAAPPSPYRLQSWATTWSAWPSTRAYASFLQLADRQREVFDTDLHILIEQEKLVAIS